MQVWVLVLPLVLHWVLLLSWHWLWPSALCLQSCVSDRGNEKVTDYAVLMIRSQVCQDIYVLAKWKWEDIFMKWPENVRCQTVIISTDYVHACNFNISCTIWCCFVYDYVCYICVCRCMSICMWQSFTLNANSVFKNQCKRDYWIFIEKGFRQIKWNLFKAVKENLCVTDCLNRRNQIKS